ncbi:Ldh family oxidoreductase [Bacillus sp. ISL-41]|uniref:Ldh family oxidoreductase n=1 Tax=Bacillus sp. ISL-41 TaxID=2819127 RepID=UPI001BE6B6FC|nr:Ldh family oxidoreductase [Bacillus sp. ISL-41]MBT2642497.1 Ldh family oxidoreductase [Bacillus sp. ISL-41]
MKLIDADELKVFAGKVLEKAGVNSENAQNVADALIRANLEGVDSHGISRLAIYTERLIEKRINPKPNILFEERGTSILTVDGDNGLGHAVSSQAIKKGINMAKQSGMVGISIKNSNHFGTASFYCQMACDHNLAAMAFTNSPPGIAPWGGRKAFFGTNPIAFGFPTGNSIPVIIDLSTSIAARGKIILADKQGESIPDGWAMDENGEMTNDPSEALKGAVLPFGGAKGSALALAVEVLAGVLTGAAFGPHVNSIYQDTNKSPANVGHFFILIDIEKFMPFEQFTYSMNELLKEMKQIPKAQGIEEIRYPGERRNQEFEKRITEGIPISANVQEELIRLGDKFDISFPKPQYSTTI